MPLLAMKGCYCCVTMMSQTWKKTQYEVFYTWFKIKFMILTGLGFYAHFYTLNYSFHGFPFPRLSFHANIVIIVKNNATIVIEWIIIKINDQSQNRKGYLLRGIVWK